MENIILDSTCILGTHKLIATLSNRDFDKLILHEYTFATAWPNPLFIYEYCLHLNGKKMLSEEDKRLIEKDGPVSVTSIHKKISKEKEKVLELIEKLIDIGRLELIGTFHDVMKDKVKVEVCDQIISEIHEEYFKLNEETKSKLLLLPTDFESISIACTQGFYFESFNDLLKNFIKNISTKHNEKNSTFFTPKNLKAVDIEEYITPNRNKKKVDKFFNEIKVHRTHFSSILELFIGFVPIFGNIYSVDSTRENIVTSHKNINKKKVLFKTTESHILNNDLETVALFNNISNYIYERAQSSVNSEFGHFKD